MGSFGNSLRGNAACKDNKLCATCGSTEELKSDLIKYKKLIKKNPNIQKEFLLKGENNLSINDNRYHHCYVYRTNTLGFYSYKEAMHTFKKIYDKEKENQSSEK